MKRLWSLTLGPAHRTGVLAALGTLAVFAGGLGLGILVFGGGDDAPAVVVRATPTPTAESAPVVAILTPSPRVTPGPTPGASPTPAAAPSAAPTPTAEPTPAPKPTPAHAATPAPTAPLTPVPPPPTLPPAPQPTLPPYQQACEDAISAWPASSRAEDTLMPCRLHFDGLCQSGVQVSCSAYADLLSLLEDLYPSVAQPPTPSHSTPAPLPTPAPPLAGVLTGQPLIAQDGEFLGTVTCSRFEGDGIFNRFGTYGSRFSSNSIWNRFGTYGGRFGTYSPFNRFGQPPFITDGESILAYLTVSTVYSPAVTPLDLVLYCFSGNASQLDYWLERIEDST